jgi:MOSC domain-containing protein YiiM
MSVNIGHAVDASWAGALKRTAIDKRPLATAVPAGVLGLAGDEQAGGAGARIRRRGAGAARGR